MLDIVMQTGASYQSVYRWIGKFEKEGVDFIAGKRHKTPEREKFFSDRKTRVIEILHSSPQLYGINRATWSYESIADAYNQTYEDRISPHMVGRVIHTTGYTWRHARTVLTSPDPQYKEKTTKVLGALRNLKEDEAFFFIDEAGPYAVKHYTGKALTPKGTVRVVPQYQKIKGNVTFIGALNAVTNQMTWAFIDAKSTSQVILLLEMLKEQYASYAKLFLTWDAASWHSSEPLRDWVAKTAEECRKRNSVPLFELLPLPINSQFLNVIEAVISGMKRAVIHNSDYATEGEMKAAISRHFEERNRYFRENPKRAGNKIWDKQFFSVDQIQGGLFKKM
jgi:transposase